MLLSIDRRPLRSLHFVGICGSGMSALAQYARWSGCTVSGSDRGAQSEGFEQTQAGLVKAGCRIVAQDGSALSQDTDAVIVSTAIEETNPDIASARKQNIPLLHRSDLLALFVASRQTIAIAGTSGKSTVTALCFELLRAAGKDPSLITGANLSSLKNQGHLGNAYFGKSDLLVIEADESDGTLVKYHPKLSVVLNVSRDHKPVDETLGLFATLAAQSGSVLANADCAALSAVSAQHTFSANSPSDFCPDSVTKTVPHIEFSYANKSMKCPLPGTHNLANIMAALAVCELNDCTINSCAKALESFQGLDRRFTIIATTGTVTVIDDFAHNPEKIEAVLRTAQTMSQRVHAIFQPHGYGPTRFLRNDLIEMFKQVLRQGDTLYLLPIFFAGGTVVRDISSEDLASELREHRIAATAPLGRPECIELLRKSVRPGDLVISMGARDPSLPAFAKSIATALGSI